MSTDPTYVTPAQLRAAYDALGLDPELFTSTRTIQLDPHKVVAIRYVRLDRSLVLGEDHEPVVRRFLDLPVADTDPTDMTAMLHESFGDGRQLLAAIAEPDETHGCGDPDCHDCGTTA